MDDEHILGPSEVALCGLWEKAFFPDNADPDPPETARVRRCFADHDHESRTVVPQAPVTRVHEMLTDRHTAVKCHPKFREKFTAKYQARRSRGSRGSRGVRRAPRSARGACRRAESVWQRKWV